MKVFMLLSIFILSSVSILEADNKGIEESSSDYDYRGKLNNLKDRLLVINNGVGAYASWDVYTHLMDARDRFLQFDENLANIDSISGALGVIANEMRGVANDYLAISGLTENIGEQMVTYANDVETIDIENDEVIALLDGEISVYEAEISDLENYLTLHPGDGMTIAQINSANAKKSLLEQRKSIFNKLAGYLEQLVPVIQSFSQSINIFLFTLGESAEIYDLAAENAEISSDIHGAFDEFDLEGVDEEINDLTIEVMDDWSTVVDISGNITDSVVIDGP